MLGLDQQEMMEILTLLLVVITGVYAWLTHGILKANQKSVETMKDQIEASFRPHLIGRVTSRIGTDLLILRIENIGRSVANRLRVRMDRDYFQNAQRNGSNLKELEFFNREIASFAPGQYADFMLGRASMLLGEGASSGLSPRRFCLTFDYESVGKEYKDVQEIDVGALSDTLIEHNSLVDEVKKIPASIDSLKKVIERK